MSKKNMPSNEAAFRALVSGEKTAKHIILENFEHFIRARVGSILSQNSNIGLDYHDLYHIGYTALYKAVRKYRGDNIPFTAFATVVIQNALFNAVKQATNPTNQQLNRGISLDDTLYDNNNSLLMSDVITVPLADDVGFYTPHSIGYFEDKLPQEFTKMEMLVLKGKLEGYTFGEIAKAYGIAKRKMDAVIVSLKEKWNLDDKDD